MATETKDYYTVEWQRWDEINRRRSMSLIHISVGDGSTLCGVPIPTHGGFALIHDEGMVCRRCGRNRSRAA